MTHEIEPVSAVGGSKASKLSVGQQILKKRLEEEKEMREKEKANAEKARNKTPEWIQSLTMKHAVKKYSCYMLFLNVIQHISLGGMQGQMVAEAQLMNVQHDIQKNLLIISNYLSYLKGNAQSDGAASNIFTNGYNPNAMNGLGKGGQNAIYKVGNQTNIMGQPTGNYGQEQASQDYINQTNKFVKAFKQLFYANTDKSAPTFEQLSKITNPNQFPSGKDFDLTKYWGELNQHYSQFNKQGYNVFATKNGEHASLIQQYCYLKAQVAVDQGSKLNINKANGDITKLVNFNVDEQECDPVIKSNMQIVSDFMVSEKVTRAGGGHNAVFASETQSGLDLILSGQCKAFSSSVGSDPTNVGASETGKQVGLLGYFSYAAYNYFWVKNPAAKANSLPAGLAKSNPLFGSIWKCTNQVGVSSSDIITSVSLATSGNQTNLGEEVGQGSVQIQSLTTNEGQDVNIVQTGLQGKKQQDSTELQNQKAE